MAVFTACNDIAKNQIVIASSQHLKLNNGVLFYNKIPFNGQLITRFSDGKLKSDIVYVKGRKHGYEKHWHPNDTMAIERYYTMGFKTGIHRAWWENGNPKFIYPFNAKGEYHGNSKEWYVSGQLFKDFNYVAGQEIGSQRLWKPDGKTKANYKVRNGERFGLIGLKKCHTLTINRNEIK